MIKVGLTGGIGSGKSEVARLLAGHGAVVVDADALAREAVAPGSEGLAQVVASSARQSSMPRERSTARSSRRSCSPTPTGSRR